MSDPRPLRSSPWFLGALLLAVGWWILDLAVLGAGVPHPHDDLWEDGIVARMLVEGHGFRTHMIYPPLWELRDPRTLTLPVLIHGPLMPLLFTPVAFEPALLDHVAWLGALCAVLALAPLFRLAARRFDEPVAAAACGLFTLSPMTTDAVNHYATVVLGAWLLAWAIDLVARDRPRAIAAGLVAGVCWLARPEMLIAAPILAWVAATAAGGAAGRGARAPASGPARGWLVAAGFAGGFVAATAWWWWERWRATGSPLFNLTSYLLASFSPAHPGDGLVRDFDVTPRRFPAVLVEALPSLPGKWAHTFPRAIRRALGSPADTLGWLALVGLLVALATRQRRRLIAALALLAAIPLVSVVLIAPVRLYVMPFLPLYALAAALGARAIAGLRPWGRRPRAWLGLLALLALPPAALELRRQADLARALERWLAADRAALTASARSPRDTPELMFSDTPDFVAWTTGRPTVWLTRAEFESVFRPGAEPPPGMPRRPEPEDTWFHHADARDPWRPEGHRLPLEIGDPASRAPGGPKR